MLTNFNEDFKVPTDAFKFVNSLDEEAKNYDKDLRRLCQNAISEFGDMQDKSAEVASNIKAVNVETKKVQQELKTNNSNDQSGYLDVSTIETYGNAIDKVLGNIAQKQEDINAKRQRAVDLEKDILSNTTLTREGLSRELEEYTKVLNKFDTEKITKLAASLKETRTATEQPVQTEQIHPTQPKKKEPVKLGGGGISGFNKEKSEETTVPIKGKITITDADISVDVKNPVKIPGVAVIDSNAVQIGSIEDLKSSADALSLANKSLSGIISKTEGYVSSISALGPAFQYVAQEVDNLSSSLENQILDFSKISEQTNTYIGKTGSISIGTSNMAVTGKPAAITGKVVLGTDDVVPPEAPVDIKGHVDLKTTDITPPSEPVELQGKIAKTTMESAAKGKKKKGQDIEKPEVIELNGHVKLEDKDIERPDPVVMNGKVVVTKNNIKLPEGGIDVKGNLILKNAEIANAIKEAAGKESSEKNSTKSKKDSTIIDTKAQQEANRLLQQEEQLQQKIADAAQKKAEAENKSFNRDVAAAQKKYDQAELDNLKEIESIYRRLASLERKRGRYTKPERAFDLHQTEEQISAEEADLNRKMLSASEVGYNPLKVTSIRKQALEYYYAQASSDNKFDTVKKQEAIKVQQEANDTLRQEEVVREKITEAAKRQEEAENKILMRDIAAQEKKDASDGSKAIDDIVSSYQKIISLQKQRGKFVDSKDKEDLDEINNQLSEEENYLSELMFNFQDSTGVNPYQFTAVSKIAELAEKEYQSFNKTIDIRRNGKVQDLVDQLSAEQKKYGTVEETEATGKVSTSIQLALQTQQQLIDAIGKTTIGTEEYNNAVKAAEANWKNVKIEIDASNKAQKKLSDQTTSILRKFETLKEEASQGSNEELKNGIEGILTRTRNLNTQDPHTYENYANELIQLKQDSYAVQAKHTLWHKGYKGLEKKGNQIAQGVEVARQMQEDGSLQDVDFKNIDELIEKLNALPAQSDTYAETLKEIDTLWQEIKKKVDAVNESEKQAAKKQTAKIRDVKNILTAQRQNKNLIETVRGNNGSGEEFYSQLSEKQSKLNLLFEAIDGASDSEQALKAWASQNLKESADNINSVTDAIRTLDKEYNDAQSSAESFNRTISQERSTNKAATEVANLKSQIHDYLETNKKIQSSNLAQPFQNLMNALNSETAPEKIGELKKQFAELRVQAKELGLESENLFDKFEKLFGQHLSTMITMAALHKMQDALRIVYQNVVEIDTAVTELRKVSEYAGKSLEEYMSRASEQAQKLGVSISNYVNSTADWKRLGYSDEDAENMATYSTLLKNVGDGIDDVNTSSSYLISTLQGFGLLADQAEDVVNKIDAVANTQPVTANDLGEILTRSSAAMAAANNTLEETLALGTAANSVVQDADSVGTMLKSLSMYLRAAKTDAENAGIEVDGMANSVSELRSELKSLTGVDIMLDSKNFKSTYQIMKELSQVWGNLSDVTQANVTEMIAGKRNSNAVSAILNNFSVAESTMESAANSANVAWEENEKYLDSIQGRLAQLDASFQVLSTDVLSSDLVKSGVSFLTSIVKFLDKIINLTGALPAGLGIAAFATQLGEPKMTGFMIVPSNTPGGDTEQACGVYYIKCCSAREYLVKPTNMAA